MTPVGRAAAAFFVLLSGTACGAAETCPESFAAGRRPRLTNPKLATDTIPLCYDAFALLYSGAARAPLYAAERLTRVGITAARTIDRVDSFHDEDRLPEAGRARLEDYVHSGFDRGHVAPAGDMPTAAAQEQSFSLANVVPQERTLNRGLWSAIEESVRRLATARGTLFVVTGPIYSGGTVEAVNGRVLVPGFLFKAVYDPARGEAAAYLVPNRAEAEWRAVSLAELEALSGLDVFPGLGPGARATAMALPEPRAYSRGDAAGDGHIRGRPRAEPSFETWAKAELHRLARRLWRDLMRALF